MLTIFGVQPNWSSNVPNYNRTLLLIWFSVMCDNLLAQIWNPRSGRGCVVQKDPPAPRISVRCLSVVIHFNELVYLRRRGRLVSSSLGTRAPNFSVFVRK